MQRRVCRQTVKQCMNRICGCTVNVFLTFVLPHPTARHEAHAEEAPHAEEKEGAPPSKRQKTGLTSTYKYRTLTLDSNPAQSTVPIPPL